MKSSEPNSKCDLKLPCGRCGLWPLRICQGIFSLWLHTPVFSMLCWPLRMPIERGLCYLDSYRDAPETIGCGISSWFVRLLCRVRFGALQMDSNWNRSILGEANDLFAVQMSIPNLELRFSSPNSFKMLHQYWGYASGRACLHIYFEKLSIYLWIVAIKWIWPRCSVAWHFRATFQFNTYTLARFESGWRMQLSLIYT